MHSSATQTNHTILHAICLLLLTFLIAHRGFAQDSAFITRPARLDSSLAKRQFKTSFRPFVLPLTLIASGSVVYGMEKLRHLDYSARHSINDMPPSRLEIDDYTQFVPAALVYGLNLIGVKGKHNFVDRTALLATSQLLTAAIVLPSKRIIGRERPDGSDNFSFPSGHAAVAFASAQFLFKEYRETNFWLAISGYPVAVFTSVSRVIESRHWVSDIVAGTGVGILSTELAYKIYPYMNKLVRKHKKRGSIVISPYYQPKAQGLVFLKQF